MNTHRNQRGLTLVELLVALAVTLFLMAGAVQVYLANKQSYSVQEAMARLQENARFAMAHILDSVQAAGYMGCLDPDGLVVNTIQGATGTLAYDFVEPVDGVEGAAGASDQLTLRRVPMDDAQAFGIRVTAPMASQTAALTLDSANARYGVLAQYDILAVSDCAATAVFMITNDPTTSGGTIQHLAAVAATAGPNTGQQNQTDDLQHIFGAEAASVAWALPVVTTTYTIGASASGASALLANGAEVVEGITGLQVLYGEDTDGDADRTADRFVAAGSAGLTMADVTALRITLTASAVGATGSSGVEDRTITTTVRLRSRL